MSEHELLKIFDDKRNQIGVAPRSDVHRLGYWHEAFHCWFICREKGEDYIYLQLRSKNKKDYPNLFDITAAGHLLANETVMDGVREIKEEIGIHVVFEDLVQLGVFDYSITSENFIDKELANVFLYKSENSFADFTLQLEEVTGIVRAKLIHFADLWLEKRERIAISGFEHDSFGNVLTIEENITRGQFVPHPVTYYHEVIKKIQEHIGRDYDKK